MTYFMNNNNNVLVSYNLDKTRSQISFVDNGITYNFNFRDWNRKEYIFIGPRLQLPSSEFLRSITGMNQSVKTNISNYFVTKDKIEAIREYFQKQTENKFVAKCVFHADRHPSMSVDLDRGLFNCFSCRMGGSVVRLHKKITQK